MSDRWYRDPGKARSGTVAAFVVDVTSALLTQIIELRCPCGRLIGYGHHEWGDWWKWCSNWPAHRREWRPRISPDALMAIMLTDTPIALLNLMPRAADPSVAP